MQDINWSREVHFNIDSNVVIAIVLLAIAGFSLRYYLKRKKENVYRG